MVLSRVAERLTIMSGSDASTWGAEYGRALTSRLTEVTTTTVSAGYRQPGGPDQELARCDEAGDPELRHFLVEWVEFVTSRAFDSSGRVDQRRRLVIAGGADFEQQRRSCGASAYFGPIVFRTLMARGGFRGRRVGKLPEIAYQIGTEENGGKGQIRFRKPSLYPAELRDREPTRSAGA
jgi:hypothetical protein